MNSLFSRLKISGCTKVFGPGAAAALLLASGCGGAAIQEHNDSFDIQPYSEESMPSRVEERAFPTQGDGSELRPNTIHLVHSIGAQAFLVLHKTEEIQCDPSDLELLEPRQPSHDGPLMAAICNESLDLPSSLAEQDWHLVSADGHRHTARVASARWAKFVYPHFGFFQSEDGLPFCDASPRNPSSSDCSPAPSREELARRVWGLVPETLLILRFEELSNQPILAFANQLETVSALAIEAAESPLRTSIVRRFQRSPEALAMQRTWRAAGHRRHFLTEQSEVRVFSSTSSNPEDAWTWMEYRDQRGCAEAVGSSFRLERKTSPEIGASVRPEWLHGETLLETSQGIFLLLRGTREADRVLLKLGESTEEIENFRIADQDCDC